MNPNTAFIDIETTGLSAEVSALTILGVKKPSGTVRQWFNETGREQKKILCEFLTYISDFDTLITFNGSTFDLPFLIKKCEEYGLSHSLNTITHIDLYQRLKKWKHLFPWKNLKQKTIESYLGIHRKDSLSSKVMIRTYQDYISSNDASKKEALLLHNKEDLEGLETIYSLLYFESICNGDFEITSSSMDDSLKIQFHTKLQLLHSMQFNLRDFILECNENQGILTCYLTDGLLPHFYPDIKNYCYLEEDSVLLPQSMATTVPKEQRKKPTPDQCFSNFKPTKDFLLNKEQVHTFCMHSMIYILRKDTTYETLITT